MISKVKKEHHQYITKNIFSKENITYHSLLQGHAKHAKGVCEDTCQVEAVSVGDTRLQAKKTFENIMYIIVLSQLFECVALLSAFISTKSMDPGG